MGKKYLKVLFVASECAPIAKVGGLGDVIGSLPKALKKLRVDLRIAIPKYKGIDFKKHLFKIIAKKIKVGKSFVNIYQGFLPGSKVILYLLENKKYFGENGIYFERGAFVGSFREIQRFLFFSQAILEIFENLNWFPQIIHCHDWHTAIAPLLLKIKTKNKKPKTLLTIHNLANQGEWRAKKILDFLNLKGDEIDSLKIRDKRKKLNILAQGILNTDFLNTVSKTYSQEILTKKYGEDLEKILSKRKKDLFGILNGIDQDRFNPKACLNLKVNYSVSNLNQKRENKIDLQKILKLSQNQNFPLFSLIGRLTSQKGIDLIAKIVPDLVNSGCQLIILGVGERKYENKLLKLAKKYQRNVSVQIKFDPVLAQKIYAGSDFFLMPSRFEPCGLGQLIAQRYGTIPIGRKTGGLADTIEQDKTGFLFKEYKAGAFLRVIRKALKFYQNEKEWKKLIKRAMKKDFSWKKSAKEYLKLYNKLIA
ncbi:glycogen synthase [Patescibacteria group bacterium]|nr:glycogen synthase [Patescibacteria group bacterium]